MMVFININSSQNFIWADFNNDTVFITFRYPIDNFSPILKRINSDNLIAVIPYYQLLLYELIASISFLVLYNKNLKYDKRHFIKKYLVPLFIGNTNQLNLLPR